LINSRIGANYLQYNSAGTGFVLNKTLFLVGNLVAYFCHSGLIACASLVIMCVPLVKKIAVNIFDKHCACESLSVFSGVILLLALKDVKSALELLMVYHTFDALIFCVHLKAIEKCIKNSVVFENPIEYRVDEDGNYIVSNNEFTPAEGKVVCGSALADDSLVSANDELITVQSGDNLPFSCKIVSGSIVYAPYRKTDKSVYSTVKKCFFNILTCENNNASASYFDVFRLAQTVAFLVFAASALCFGAFDRLSFLAVLFALLSVTALIATCRKACRVDFLSKLNGFSIFPLKENISVDAKIADSEKLFESGDIAKYDIFTFSLSKDDTRNIINKLLKKLSLKYVLLNAAVVINVAVFVLSCLIVNPAPMYFSLILSAIVSAVIVNF